MEKTSEEKITPAENVVRKACIWHSAVNDVACAPAGQRTKAVTHRENCARKLAEAVEKYKKSER